MAYGMSREAAVALMAKLQVEEPQNRFELGGHSWLSGYRTRFAGGEINEMVVAKWGVVRFTPYCKEMPWKCEGFVWV